MVSLRDRLRWFEDLPLFGRRILITRPRDQAAELAERVTALGGVPSILPTVEIREVADWAPVDAAIANLANFDWLVFTSRNGVRAFLDRLRSVGRDLRALGRTKLAAIGPKTAEALRDYHLDADLVPASATSRRISPRRFCRGSSRVSACSWPAPIGAGTCCAKRWRGAAR